MTQPYQIGNYAETYSNFRLEAPERYNWAYDVFDRWAEDPDKLALFWVGASGERKVTFRELSERSQRVANALIGLGSQPGDRVFVMLPRIVEWWEILLGSIRAQTVSIPGTTLLTSQDIAYRLNAASVKIAITDSDNIDKLEAVRQECPDLEHIIVVGETPGVPSYEDLLRSSSPRLDHPQNLATDPLMIYFTSGQARSGASGMS